MTGAARCRTARRRHSRCNARPGRQRDEVDVPAASAGPFHPAPRRPDREAGLADTTRASGAAPAAALTARERELLDLVAEGLTDQQIAQKLFISIRTVRSHLDRIRDKTGARRRADLTRLALAQPGLP